MTFRIGPFNYKDCLYVADRITREDMSNIAATRPDVTPARLAAVCEAAQDLAVVAYYGREPVAVMGAIPWHEGVYSGYMFATDRFPVVGLAMTKWARRTFFVALRKLGARRVETHIIERDQKTQRWLSAIGAKKEAIVPRFGVGGEDFVRYAYLWDEDKG